jgi:hypothetical protein
MAQQATININLNSKQAQGNLDNLTGSINSAGGSAASLRLELRKTIQELQNLEPGSARFRELSLRAGELRDQIADTNAVVGQLAGNVAERLTRGIAGVVQVGVAGFQTLTAGLALFGGESEELTKTLVRLNALMNLSQAVETFAGLDQKLVEIRASFQSLTTATVQQTVAQEGENIATAQGTVATNALGLAMKALPIIAIVAGLATLTYGLYQYVTGSEEADKQEKKRKKNLEDLKKLQKETTDSVVKESSEFTSLVYQLKATNAGSERRKQLIKDINSEYGTTLQNLSDEKAFQDQLNSSVEDYITLQYNRFKLNKNQEYIDQQNDKRFEGEQKINKARREAQDLVDAGIRKSVEDALSYREDLRILISEGEKAVNQADASLAKLGLRREQLSVVEDKLTKGGKQYVKQTKESSDTTKDATDATDKYAEALEKIKQELERQQAAEQGLQDIQDERLSRASAQVSEELKLIETFNKEQEDLVKVATQREIEALDEKFKKGLVNEEEYKKGRIEIQEGGLNNLLQVETQLLNEKKALLSEDLQNVEDKYDLEGQITQQAIKQIQDETRLLNLQFQKSQELEAIENSTLTEEKKQEAILDVKKKYLDEEVKLIEQSAQNQINALTLQKEKQLDNEQLTADERTQIEEKYNQDVLKVSEDTQGKIQDAINGTKDVQKTATEEFQDQIEKIQEYLDLITGLYNQFSDTVSMISQSRTKQREAEVEGLYAFEREALENQLAEGLVSREQYDNKLLELDQQREQEQQAIARKEFETNKKLNMANAVINGAQAVLQALASSPPPLSFILAALVGGLAAVQFGVISSEEFTAAGGGIVPGTGSGMIDSVPAMLAPGETVINAQSSAMYPELLNQVNMAGGGISLKPDLPAVNKSNGDTRVFGDNKVDKPIRAYVVETDVTDTQKRVDRIKRSAEF